MMLTSATASAAAGTITSFTFVFIAIGMACAIGIIVWGTMRRRTKAAEIAEAERHAVLADHAPKPETLPGPDVPPVPVEPSPIAVAPTAIPEAEAPAPQPEPEPGAKPEPASTGSGYPITVLKGLGPRASTRLGELGITTVDDLVRLSPAELAAIDAQMGALTGRIERDRWIEQARLLAAGDKAGFEAAFGKLGS